MRLIGAPVAAIETGAGMTEDFAWKAARGLLNLDKPQTPDSTIGMEHEFIGIGGVVVTPPDTVEQPTVWRGAAAMGFMTLGLVSGGVRDIAGALH